MFDFDRDYDRYRSTGSYDNARDGAVVILEGEIMISEKGHTHSMILTEGKHWARDYCLDTIEDKTVTFGHLFGTTIFLQDWQFQHVGGIPLKDSHNIKQLRKIAMRFVKYNLVIVDDMNTIVDFIYKGR